MTERSSRLRVSFGGTSREYDQDLVTLGRDLRNGVVVPHEDVSRVHLELHRQPSGWVAHDPGSTNGTYRDGRRLTTEPLQGTVTLRVGGLDGVPVRIDVLAETPAPAAAPPAGQPPVAQSPAVQPPAGQTPVNQPPAGQAPAGQAPAGQPWATPPTPSAGTPLTPQQAEHQAVLAPPGQFAHGHTVLPDNRAPGHQLITIGRTRANQVVLDDPLVSRQHATLELGAVPVLRDLGSFNGTFVNGQRLVTPVQLTPGDEIVFGNQAFVWDGNQLVARVRRADLTLTAHNITTVVGGGKTLIDNVSFALGPSSLTAVIGPSGAGKSTLLGALTGLRPATRGGVVWQGHDLYTHYDQLRYQIGLVPQQDIQHPQLTVRQGLNYAAMLRLPPDTSAEERGARVQQVVGQMQLERQIDNRIGTQLSGGQKKRVSIATELLTAPPLLFLDEPTSGLDPGLDRDVMHLLRRLANEGRVVMVVTHSVLALDVCDNVVVMAPGGRLAYFGPPQGVLAHFGCQDYPQVFDLLDEPDLWQRIPMPPPGPPAPMADAAGATSSPPQQSLARQLGTLVRRNLAVTFSDKLLMAMLIAMPLVLGLLSRVVEGDAGLSMLETADAAGILKRGEAQQRLTILIVAASLMGTAVTIRELVKERAIFQREYAVGLSPGMYLLSKIIVLGAACFGQGVLVTYLAAVGLPGPDDGVMGLGTFEVALAMGMVSLVMAITGLAVSALVTSSEQTMPALVALVMLQLVLSGSLVAVNGRAFLEQAAWLAPARWGYAAAASSVDLNRSPQRTPEGDLDPLFDPSFAQWFGSMLMLLIMAAVVGALGYWLVRRSARS